MKAETTYNFTAKCDQNKLLAHQAIVLLRRQSEQPKSYLRFLYNINYAKNNVRRKLQEKWKNLQVTLPTVCHKTDFNSADLFFKRLECFRKIYS